MSRWRDAVRWRPNAAMAHLLELLREKPWIWGIPLLLLVINVAVLSTYRTIFSGRVDALEEQVQSERERLQGLRSTVARVERKVSLATGTQEAIQKLYNASFATEEERFTSMVREVRKLAVDAGLAPNRISYPESEIEDFALFERGITFDVEGTYLELRRFVNFLELTDSFVVLQSLRLGQADNQRLRIALALSTLFSGRDLELPSTDEATL